MVCFINYISIKPIPKLLTKYLVSPLIRSWYFPQSTLVTVGLFFRCLINFRESVSSLAALAKLFPVPAGSRQGEY